ncbi:MAG: hypothetical protein AABX38_01190 [Candidatus Micrarchaeota archaeon]
MEQKTLITGALVVLSLFLIYLFFFQEPDLSINDILRDKTTPGQFVSAVISSNNIYIVQDLVNSNESVRKNIQQCGIDFAGSAGLATKDKKIFAFEDGKCYRLDNSLSVPINKCLLEIKNNLDSVVFYIKQGQTSTFYNQGILVGLGQNYSRGDCNVNFVNLSKSSVASSSNNASDIIREIATDVIRDPRNTNQSSTNTSAVSVQNQSK